MKLLEQWKRDKEARLNRPREARRLAREHPDAPAETFFTADELECLKIELQIAGGKFRLPTTIMDAMTIVGAMMGMATRRGELVYLPSLKTLERAFERLETLVAGLPAFRRREAARAREEEARAREEERSARGGTA